LPSITGQTLYFGAPRCWAYPTETVTLTARLGALALQTQMKNVAEWPGLTCEEPDSA
jgi:hypothetical protein